MLKVRALLLLAAAGCGGSDPPRLLAAEPASVTSLAATAVALRGTALDARIEIDLDESSAPAIDRGWLVRVGETEVDATWRDRTEIDLTIPAGLGPGTYDVMAVSPRGDVLVLHDGLAISAEPIGLALVIEDAPGGAGQPVGANLVAGDSLDAYAVVRDPAGAFVADVEVTWTTSAPIGSLVPAGTSAQLRTERAGTARFLAHHAGAMLDAESDDISVAAGPPAAIAIVDAPMGTVIGAVSGLTTDSDGALTAYAVSVDTFGNPIAPVATTWSLTGVTGALPLSASSSAVVDFTTPGTGVLTATHASLGSSSTGTLDVVAGRAAQLAIAPSNLTISADAAPILFTASALDADGNATTNLGTLGWSVASGPISSLDPTSGQLTPMHAGSGAIQVASSWGATATTGAIEVVAGAPVALAITPPALAVTADDPPTPFIAQATDADGNPTAIGAVTWTIDAGPISELAPDGVLEPQRAGSGSIRATIPTATATAAVTIAPGRAAAFAISPATVDLVEAGAPVAFSAGASDGDGNPTTDTGTLVWSASGSIASIDPTTGLFTPTTAGAGTVAVASSYGSGGTSGAVRVLRGAALAATLTIADPIPRGRQVIASLTITNLGEVAAEMVAPCALSVTAGASIATAPSTSPSILGPGASTTFTWTLDTTVNGTVTVVACATGTDAATTAPVTSNMAPATFSIVDPAAFVTTLVLPDLVSRGSTFTVTMQVTNVGAVTATGVNASVLAPSGTAVASVISSPTASLSIAPGATESFAWTYRAMARGTLQLAGTASDGVASSTATSNLANIVEIAVVDAAVFADGTTTGYLAAHGGELYVGPNSTGESAMRFALDGSTQQPVSFAFTKDTVGSKTSNTASPLVSLGAPGCSRDTTACGPDNEDLAGAIDAVTFAGTSWLAGWNATSTGTKYLYLSSDTDSQLDFRYVDLTSLLASGTTTGVSAIAAVGTTLYIGISGKTTSSATLLALRTAPSAPGLDVSAADGANMRLDRLETLTSNADPEGIDAIGSSGGIVYVANKNAWVRSTTTSPQPVPGLCGLCNPEWFTITPSATAYTTRASRTVLGAGRLDARDRAVPFIVEFGSNLFVARNTTAGPQLWSCTPTLGRCNPSDWHLVAPNSTGDTLLSQFDDPSLTSVTMLVATPSHLYVGFDSAAGVRVFRTASSAASARADFEGLDGCSAVSHPATCAGFGGTGFGDPNNTRIFDAKAVTSGSMTRVYLSVGNGTAPIALVMVP